MSAEIGPPPPFAPRPRLSPAVIVGNPASVFVRQLALDWRARGIETTVVTHAWQGPATLPDGVPVAVPPRAWWPVRAGRRVARRLLRAQEARARRRDPERYRRAMASFTEETFDAWAADARCDAMDIAPFVRRLRPRFVFGQEAFSYGPATARCAPLPRVLFPWGGDIYLWGEASSVAFDAVRDALQSVDLACPSSTTAAEHIRDRYGVDPGRVRAVSWGVDRGKFFPAGPRRRRELCASLGIDPAAVLTLNVRRFNPAWGCRQAIEACCLAAQAEPAMHFLMLGGPGAAPYLAEARRVLADRGLTGRFTLFDGEVSLERCAELMSIADVALSLMRAPDMRSSSILQAAACGSALVLSEQREYREMAGHGFCATLVGAEDVEAASREILRYARDPQLRQAEAAANLEYVARHEDHDRQMDRMLDLIEAVCDGRLSEIPLET